MQILCGTKCHFKSRKSKQRNLSKRHKKLVSGLFNKSNFEANNMYGNKMRGIAREINSPKTVKGKDTLVTKYMDK